MLHALKEVYYSSSYKYIWYASGVIALLAFLYYLTQFHVLPLPPQLLNAQTTFLIDALFLIAILVPRPGLTEKALHREFRLSGIFFTVALIALVLVHHFYLSS